MRKKSSYRPKAMIANPIGYVMESVTMVKTDRKKILDLKIKNSEAMVALMRGQATRADIDILVAMSNVTEALIDFGFGKQHREIAVSGREAILKIVFRAVEKCKFIATGVEVQALNRLMDLHDAQMDVITLGDLEKAIHYINRKIRGCDGITLPKIDVPKASIHSKPEAVESSGCT